MSYAICSPVYDTGEPDFYDSLANLELPEGSFRLRCHGRLLDYARREMTIEALKNPDVTHIAFIDGDESCRPDAILQLALHEQPIVTGLYFGRRPPYEPMIYRDGNRAANGLIDLHQRKPLYDFPANQFIEVGSCAGGALLIAREVFAAIDTKFASQTWWDGETDLAGDECFIARAKACGFKIHCDTGVRFGHVAKITLDEAIARKLGGW
jgi:hypothetical protein